MARYGIAMDPAPYPVQAIWPVFKGYLISQKWCLSNTGIHQPIALGQDKASRRTETTLDQRILLLALSGSAFHFTRFLIGRYYNSA